MRGPSLERGRCLTRNLEAVSVGLHLGLYLDLNVVGSCEVDRVGQGTPSTMPFILIPGLFG